MYRRVELPPIPPENFALPFEGKLSPENRWVIMANLIPWSEFEKEYAQNFSEEMGAPAKPFRMALGALIIKERLGVSDRETVEQIRENPYLQYFIGMSTYSNEAPLEASMLVHFRERISVNLVNRVNKRMVIKMKEVTDFSQEEKKPEKAEGEEEISEPKNQGKLILDATCAPADIRYPNDLGILNEAREQTEEMIDSLYESIQDKLNEKPRTYRKKARKNYLEVSKKRHLSAKQRRKGIKKQLQYLKRNLAHIEQLIAEGAALSWLSKRQYKMLLVVAEVYRQQLWMWSNRKQRIDDRIVSLTQPHVRAIVRGKAGKPVEFGAKLSASCFHGYVFLDHLSWDNFNESGDLKAQIEEYKRFTGVYPESVHVDKIYRTRENRAYCQERGIRISGPPLGRPPANISKSQKKQALEDERVRNAIEGKFGQGKRRFGLNRVMAKLPSTSQTVIAITFLVMNLSTLLRQFFCLFLCRFPRRTNLLLFLDFLIRKNHSLTDYTKKNLSLQRD
jgi:hypothetical protein